MLSFDGFSVERWLPQMSEIPLLSELTGSVKASFNPFTGSFGTATADISRLVAQYDVLSDARYLLETREVLTAHYRDDLIEIERLDAGLRLLGNRISGEQEEEDSFVVIGGTATTGGTLDLSYRGTLGLHLIQPFVRGIFSQANGRLSVHGKLTGMPDELVPTADLVLESAELVPRVSLIGAQLELIEPVDLTVRPRTKDAEGNEAALGMGRFDVMLKRDGANSGRLRILRDESIIESDDLLLRFDEFEASLVRIGMKGSELGLNIPRVLRGTFNTPGLVFEMWDEIFEDRRPERRMKLSGRVEVVSGEYVANVTGTDEKPWVS